MTWKRALILVLGNLVPFLLFIYGLKCIITLSGKLTEPGKHVMGSFYLAPVKGTAAILTGLGDISFALFGYLSWSGPTTQNRALRWRALRQIVRWSALAATFFLWHSAHKLRLAS